MQVSELFIYPIKSVGGISVKTATVTDRGLQYDRRWMLIDENNRFMSQREFHQMAAIKTEIVSDGLLVTHNQQETSFLIPFTPQQSDLLDVTVWDDTCQGQLVSEEADKWFSKVLNKHCRLVYMPDESHRPTDPRYAEGYETSFSDGYAILLIGQASLDDLNSRLASPVKMDRFRPNIVFTGGEPFSEDGMHTFTINGVTFHGVKLCARCVMITIDQQTLQMGKEPTKTLASYRFKNNKILFGQNITHDNTGIINIGDELVIEELHVDNERFIIPPKERKVKTTS